MLNAANGKSRLGCTVAAKFSRQFSDEYMTAIATEIVSHTSDEELAAME